MFCFLRRKQNILCLLNFWRSQYLIPENTQGAASARSAMPLATEGTQEGADSPDECKRGGSECIRTGGASPCEWGKRAEIINKMGIIFSYFENNAYFCKWLTYDDNASAI